MDTDRVARERTVAGRQLRCQVCDYTRFFEREAQLNGAAAHFGLDWATPKATCIVCERCGYVHWFLPMRAGTEDTDLTRELAELREELEVLDEQTAADGALYG